MYNWIESLSLDIHVFTAQYLQSIIGIYDMSSYLLRVSEANEVPISSHIWVRLSTFNSL